MNYVATFTEEDRRLGERAVACYPEWQWYCGSIAVRPPSGASDDAGDWLEITPCSIPFGLERDWLPDFKHPTTFKNLQWIVRSHLDGKPVRKRTVRGMCHIYFDGKLVCSARTEPEAFVAALELQFRTFSGSKLKECVMKLRPSDRAMKNLAEVHMTKKQKEAIRGLELALSNIDDAGLAVFGEDRNLVVVTKSAAHKHLNPSGLRGVPFAQPGPVGNIEGSVLIDHPAYWDSGGA